MVVMTDPMKAVTKVASRVERTADLLVDKLEVQMGNKSAVTMAVSMVLTKAVLTEKRDSTKAVQTDK